MVGAKPSSGSLKQGVWGRNPMPEVIAKVFGFEVSKERFREHQFDGFLKEVSKMYVFIEVGGVGCNPSEDM